MVDLFCDSFAEVPRRILLDIDDTLDRVHGGQQLSLFHAHHDSRCFLPIHIYEATTGKPVAVILRPGKTPDGAEVARVLRHLVEAIRRRWPPSRSPDRAPFRVGSRGLLARDGGNRDPRRQPLRSSRGHGPPRPAGRVSSRDRIEGLLAFDGVERNRVRYVFGLAGNRVLLDRVTALAEDAAVCRAEEDADKVRRFHDFRYAAKSWKDKERRVIARIEATRQGSDTRFVVTNLAGTSRWLYEVLYCGRGQAENLLEAHELHLASDRTSCTKATANQFRLLVHTAAYWLLHTLKGLAPKTSFWRCAPFDTRSRQEAAIGHLRRRRRQKAAAAASPSSRSPPASPNGSPASRSRCRRAIPTSKASPASPATPSPCRPDQPGSVPTIEPRPSIANAAIEDRNRAPSATLEHDRLPMPNCPHELSGLGAYPEEP